MGKKVRLLRPVLAPEDTPEPDRAHTCAAQQSGLGVPTEAVGNLDDHSLIADDTQHLDDIPAVDHLAEHDALRRRCFNITSQYYLTADTQYLDDIPAVDHLSEHDALRRCCFDNISQYSGFIAEFVTGPSVGDLDREGVDDVPGLPGVGPDVAVPPFVVPGHLCSADLEASVFDIVSDSDMIAKLIGDPSLSCTCFVWFVLPDNQPVHMNLRG
eukprot:TRINITY_DN59367_c0_g1_i1.p1 TRINITY_DN59367_c0_g1~~TRINITY_DN59367_c0_g1_i1.p1  ORF type:complete len:213 (+),score=16.75 TRINITY_DN59367_c0_g1_i1:247-885(+)